MFYSEEQFHEEQDAAFGDGYPNEIARACAEARLSSKPAPNERKEAERLTRLGYAVICHEFAVYCRVTSGVIGSGFAIQRICNTRPYAEYLIRHQDYDPDDSMFVFTLPEAKTPQEALEASQGVAGADADEDLPF